MLRISLNHGLTRGRATPWRYILHPIRINSTICQEISIGFERIEELEKILDDLEIKILEIPKEALFLARKAFLKYRKSGGSKNLPLPDFFIGAHAVILGIPLITRDAGHFHNYFPSLQIISPTDKVSP